jgi:integrase
LLAEEIERLLKVAAEVGEFEHQFLTFMANTGVRPSEACTVNGYDVFDKQLFVRIKTLKQKKDFDVFRCVDLTPEYAVELGCLVRKQGCGRLFPRSRQTLWNIFKRAAKKAGIPSEYTLYSLRHSRCVYLMESTNDIPYVSKQLGFTPRGMSVYWHCVPSKRENYVKTKFESFGVKKTATSLGKKGT